MEIVKEKSLTTWLKWCKTNTILNETSTEMLGFFISFYSEQIATAQQVRFSVAD